MLLQVILVDKSIENKEALKQLIKDFCLPFQLVAEAESISTAYQLINQHQPDLVFLNLELSDGCGFDLLNILKENAFQTIILTQKANQQNLLKAIRYQVFDYFILPINPKDLLLAIERLSTALSCIEGTSSINDSFGSLPLNTSSSCNACIKIKTQMGNEKVTHCLQLDDIILCKGEGNYTVYHLTNGKKLTTEGSLGEHIHLLENYPFFQTHRSYFVNLKHVKSFDEGREGQILLTQGISAKYSRKKKTAFEQVLNQFMGIIN